MTSTMFKLVRIVIFLSIFSIPLLISICIKPDFSNFEFKVDQLQGAVDIDLPLIKWDPNKSLQGALIAEGSALITYEKNDFIYIPYFNGRLEVELNGRTVQTDSSFKVRYGVNRRSEYVLDLSEFEPQSVNKLHLKIYKTEGAFQSISNVYILKKYNLDTIKRYREVFDENIKTLIFGAVISQIIFLLIMARRSIVSSQIYPSIIILSFFAFVGSVRLLDTYEELAEILPYFWLLTPLVCVGIFDSFNQINFQKNKYFYLGKGFIQYFRTGAIFLPVFLLCISFFVEVRIINVLVSAPLLCLALFFGLIRSIKVYYFKQSSENYLYTLSYFCTIFFVIHDAAVLFGFFQSNILLSGYNALFFVISVYYSFSTTLKTSQLEVQVNEAVLVERLHLQEKELSKQHQRTQDFQIEAASQNAKKKLHEDLHDGVLNYMSIIRRITHESDDEAMGEINRLSSNASNEIRVILSQNSFSEKALLAGLLSFKNQTLDSLKHVGVKVSWDMSALADYQLLEDIHLIEIFRIVQEATHNAVHRAECRYLAFKGSKGLDAVFSIEIINTGGITLKNEIIEGSGIRNIKMRTKRIAGNFSLTSVNGGAKFVLHLPRSVDRLP